ncbi:MAG: suppressor of fused domain protein [Acidobacteria bacterium]|nr:suppressor of fused domain protein [Acidobacteriota bacterium]
MTSGPGALALDGALAQHFPGVEPVLVLMTSADRDGFDAIKVLLDREGSFWFYLTFGISDLGEKQGTHPALSGLGYELTMRVPAGPEPSPPDWPIPLLNNLARYLRPMRYDVVDSEPILFETPLTTDPPTDLTGVMFADDVQLGYGVDTPNGYVQFRQVVGIRQEEGIYQSAFGRAALVEKISRSNPFLHTILDRPSVLPPPV